MLSASQNNVWSCRLPHRKQERHNYAEYGGRGSRMGFGKGGMDGFLEREVVWGDRSGSNGVGS